MAGVMETFAQAISTLQSAQGMGVTASGRAQKYGKIAKFGRFGTSRETGKSHMWGAAILITLDKASLADVVGKLQPYKSVPTDIGTEALNNIANFFVADSDSIIRTRFETESGPLGPWPGLSEAQVQSRGGEAHPILRVSDALFNAATSDSQMKDIVTTGQYARLLIGPSERWDDLTRIKFFVHNLGSSRGWGNVFIPPRPFMPISADDLSEYERTRINKIMEDSIRTGLEERQQNRQLRAKRRAR
jgi:hypothetical protein